MARLFKLLVSFLAMLSLGMAAKQPPKTDYDVIIVGGGPAGLSAMSALCRVSRRAVLFDTAEYRNNRTRNMHDVIGADGYPPTEFRALARQQIDKYQLGTFVKTKVVNVVYQDRDGFAMFTATDAQNRRYTARRVVLATGVSDILPGTPGVDDAFGKGMYWCPWCDGFEHRAQSLAVVGPLSDALSSVLEMHNMNPDTIVLSNGTNTEYERELATNRSATWEKQLAAYNVPIINNTIKRIVRLRDGGEACSSPHSKVAAKYTDQQVMADTAEIPKVIPENPDAGPNGIHYDLFRVEFQDGLFLERASFLINVPVTQTSTLPSQLKLKMDGPKVWVGPKLITSMEGVFSIGDMNSEGATNVPHAMYNGKKAGVVIHVQLAKEDSLASIAKRSLSFINDIHLEKVTMEEIGNELEKIWDSIKSNYANAGLKI